MQSLACKKKLLDRKSTRLNSSHGSISYAVFCVKKQQQRRPWLYLSRPGAQVAGLHHERPVLRRTLAAAQHNGLRQLPRLYFFFFKKGGPPELPLFPPPPPFPV